MFSRIFKREKKTLKKIIPASVQLTMDVSEGTLMYAWGSSRRGKLGLSQSMAELRSNSQFVTECRSISAMDGDSDSEDVNEEDTERTENVYTHTPQPILSLLGESIR